MFLILCNNGKISTFYPHLLDKSTFNEKYIKLFCFVTDNMCVLRDSFVFGTDEALY